MQESIKKSTVSWQEALLYLAIAALVGSGIFVAFGYALWFGTDSEANLYSEVGPCSKHGKGVVVMSLGVIEQEEEDRIQYELQLSGQGGKKWGMWPSPQDHKEKPKPGSVRVESSEDYILTLEKVKR